MQRWWHAAILGVFLLLPTAGTADIRGLPSITVLADASLTNPLTELIRLYATEHNITVTAVYDDSSQLIEHILQGTEANIILSAHPKYITQLKQSGLLDVYSITNLLRNRIVLAAAKRHPLTTLPASHDISSLLKSVATKTTPLALLVVGDIDQTPLGIYTAQIFESLGYFDELQAIFLPASNAKYAQYLVAKAGNAGILYYTDAFNDPAITILGTFADTLHTPLIYQGAVVAGENMAPAREFLNFLKNSNAQEVFKRYGFMVETR